MTQLTWNNVGERFFEVGVDHGVLYIEDGTGVAWNGLIAVKGSPSGGEPSPYYIDGIKYLNVAGRKEFSGTIEAYTYPDEFLEYDGWVDIGNGLTVDEQRQKAFNLSYRTLLGNDVSGIDYGYKIHLVYNVLATPTDSEYTAIGDQADPISMSWSFTTTPQRVLTNTDLAMLSHIVVDSTKTNVTQLSFIEQQLYGTSTKAPSLPSLSDMVDFFQNPLVTLWVDDDEVSGLATLRNSDTLQGDLRGRANNGLFIPTIDSGLIPTSTAGLYTLQPHVESTDTIGLGRESMAINFLIYPAIDENYNFPQEVRQAIADSPEIAAAIEGVVTTDLTALDLDGGSP